LPIDHEKLSSEYSSLLKRFRLKTFFLMSMPAAWFAGLRIDRLDSENCVTSLPGGWRTQNPFKTMYWAVQGMGAELATGAAPFAISKSMPEKLRMFVVGTEAKFIKRANGRIHFNCSEVSKTKDAIQESMDTGQSVEVDIKSTGTDSSGEIVSEWIFKWNFLVTK